MARQGVGEICELYIPSKKEKKEKNPWVSKKKKNRRRKKGFGSPAKEGPLETDGLILAYLYAVFSKPAEKIKRYRKRFEERV